jgi:hypothetical protein
MPSVAYACPDDDPDSASSPVWFPVLTGDGWIPVAQDANGSTVFIPLCDSSQVRNGTITGHTRTGKSVSAMAVLLPGVVAGVETMLLADGQRGMGFPALRPVVSRYGRSPQQWRELIELAHRVLIGRMDRRGAAGTTRWSTTDETDPIVTLVLNEAGAINPHLTSRQIALVNEIISQGGPVGVRVVQITESLNVEDIIGGARARDLSVYGGWAICHRSGPGAAALARQFGANIDLRDLAAGQAAVMIGGTAAPSPSQVRHVSDEQIADQLAGLTARHLQGEDAAAAGPDYSAAHWDDWTPRSSTSPAENDAEQVHVHAEWTECTHRLPQCCSACHVEDEATDENGGE